MSGERCMNSVFDRRSAPDKSFSLPEKSPYFPNILRRNIALDTIKLARSRSERTEESIFIGFDFCFGDQPRL